MALDHYGRECVLCGSNKNLEVHHRHYKSGWGNEKVEDLIVLCKDHHATFEYIKKENIPFVSIVISNLQSQITSEIPQLFIEYHFNSIITILNNCEIKKGIKKELVGLWTKIMSELGNG